MWVELNLAVYVRVDGGSVTAVRYQPVEAPYVAENGSLWPDLEDAKGTLPDFEPRPIIDPDESQRLRKVAYREMLPLDEWKPMDEDNGPEFGW